VLGFNDTVRRARLAAAAMLAFSCGACAVGPDFRTPTPPPPMLTAEPLPAQTMTTPVAGGHAQIFKDDGVLPAHWWTLFGSQQLNDLVARALRDNPTVASAQAALRQATQLLTAQRAGLFPSLTGNVNVSLNKNDGAEEGEPQLGGYSYTLYNTNVSVSYALDPFGGVRRGIEAQAAAREAKRNALQATYQTLASNVVTTAILEASLRAQVSYTQELLSSAQHGLTLTTQMFELGGATRADLLAAESTLASFQADLPPLQQKLAEARSQLAVYVGTLPGQYGERPFDLDDLTLPRDIPILLPSDLVRQRPDIREAEARLHVASANIGVATANLLPQFNITGTFGDVSTTLSTLFRSNVYALAGGVVQPLFQGGALTAKRRAAIGAYDQALAEYRQTVLLACKNVADVLHQLDNDAKTLAAQYSAQASALEGLHLTEQRYGVGGANNLELLIAQERYHTASITYVQTLAARYQDTAALFQAVGGDWDATAVSAAAVVPKPSRQ
jgi:NodT family efflux transporter outer membrane factor (OMF) lipoprotein